MLFLRKVDFWVSFPNLQIMTLKVSKIVKNWRFGNEGKKRQFTKTLGMRLKNLLFLQVRPSNHQCYVFLRDYLSHFLALVSNHEFHVVARSSLFNVWSFCRRTGFGLSWPSNIFPGLLFGFSVQQLVNEQREIRNRQRLSDLNSTKRRIRYV